MTTDVDRECFAVVMWILGAFASGIGCVVLTAASHDYSGAVFAAWMLYGAALPGVAWIIWVRRPWSLEARLKKKIARQERRKRLLQLAAQLEEGGRE